MSSIGPLRVACLATHAGHAGGAAIAMERLAGGLRVSGAAVEIVTRDACGRPPLWIRGLDRRIRRGLRRGRTPVSNTLFTADWPAWDVSGHPGVVAADVVSVHWVAGFVSAAGIRRIVEAGRPVAWTLHDLRPFTGGCHYPAGCSGFTAGCEACPQLGAALRELPARSLIRSRRRLQGLPLAFVAPSRWIADELRRSTVFDPECHDVTVIPNGLDLSRYRPGDRAAARRRLGLPAAGLAILLGSVSLAERRKGADTAIAAVAAAAAAAAGAGSAPPVVVTYGAGEVSIPGVACRHLGTVAEDGVLDALHACDLHLALAREDNLPNTVMEALACAVPVLATRSGGLPELVADGAEGWLVDVDDPAAAAAALVRLARDPEAVVAAGRRGRQRAETEWDVRLVARRYLALFADLASRQSRVGPGAVPAVAPVGLTPSVAGLVRSRGGLRGPLRHLRRLAAPPVRPTRGILRTRSA